MQKKLHNPYLGANRTLEGFIELMENFNRPSPMRIDCTSHGNSLDSRM